MSDTLPPQELMSLAEIQGAVTYWYDFNCPLKEMCDFASIGQHLLHLATRRNKTLLTVQIGAMDGVSNDPFHKMFVGNNDRKEFKVSGGGELLLGNWLPVLI